jgi:hypothetical protein
VAIYTWRGGVDARECDNKEKNKADILPVGKVECFSGGHYFLDIMYFNCCNLEKVFILREGVPDDFVRVPVSAM